MNWGYEDVYMWWLENRVGESEKRLEKDIYFILYIFWNGGCKIGKKEI